ncbi:ABC-type dipeptide/oligopeptide/nickel transport system permease subunit [Actinomadura coerulea]|uniref:ABC-type dipeptide/oligopeptide/nickel transport system permease subunit n=1 Tax=Actinomadura coerulea TaxID=46159 RepID=A0A7X0FVB2_9ACTN|nr:ABC transporter permease [Actinomadura coerulea]MBB6394374.1 ABC-type dipeptide/oligopeptide/nickel transport system permease subunit [Actinomadura coerulea]GGQ40972.1 putative peptide ABC transporter DppC [Actinomadura coerulea]
MTIKQPDAGPPGAEPEPVPGPGAPGTSAAAVAVAGGAIGRASLWDDAWHELRRRWLFWGSVAVLALVTVMAVAPRLFTATAVNEGCDPNDAKLGPSGGHWFGTDLAGCDYYAHVVHGARPTLLIGVAVTVFALLIALLFGLLAGYYGGIVDALIARLTDVFFGLPFVLGATVILVAFPSHGVWAMTLVLVLLGWTTMIRIMRGQVISVRDADYVQAARLLGASDRRIMLRHILPNAIAPVIVVATLNVGHVIVGEATLDFLGVGLQYPEVSWGLQLNQAKDSFVDHPHLLIFPAVFLSATVLSFLMLGDAVRDALDPKLR